jgi:TatD DNase family protein
MILDIHAHGIDKLSTAIVSGSVAEINALLQQSAAGLLSVGVHPWRTAELTPEALEAELQEVARLVQHPQVVAIGEAGLDTLRGASPELQMDVLKAQIAISEHVGKPLVLHVVRSGNRIMELCKAMRRTLTQPWVWHGFRGGEAEARQFLALRPENYISLGQHFNPAAARVIPADRLLVETDEAPIAISAVVQAVEAAREEPLTHLAANIAQVFAVSGK